MSTSTDDQIREDVERALRRMVEVSVVTPWRLATWVPRCVLRTMTRLARQTVSPAEADRSAMTTSPTSASAPPAPTATDPPPNAASLPIDDYESLAASQVVTRLAALSSSERNVVREFEAATRGRRTIIGKIDQLEG